MIFYFFLLFNYFVHANSTVPRASVSVQTIYENFRSPLEYLEVPERLKQSVTATKTILLADKLVQEKKLSLVDLKLESYQYLDVLYLIKNESTSNRYFTLSSQQLNLAGKILVECLCDDIYFLIPPKSAWTRVVRWTILNADKDVLITMRNKVTGFDESKMNSKMRKSIYKARQN